MKIPSIDHDRVINIICNFLKTRLEESNCNGYVIGLSGGIDSALAASLIVKAIGSERVKAYFLPTSTTPEKDLSDVKTLCSNLNISLEEVDLQNVLDNFSATINDPIIPFFFSASVNVCCIRSCERFCDHNCS